MLYFAMRYLLHAGTVSETFYFTRELRVIYKKYIQCETGTFAMNFAYGDRIHDGPDTLYLVSLAHELILSDI